jgi:N-ethylmaleimide reductase
MHGSSCRIFALCSPAAYGSTRAARDMLAAGADLVALGRPFLANPDLVRRLRLGAPLNPVRDRYLM